MTQYINPEYRHDQGLQPHEPNERIRLRVVNSAAALEAHAHSQAEVPIQATVSSELFKRRPVLEIVENQRPPTPEPVVMNQFDAARARLANIYDGGSYVEIEATPESVVQTPLYIAPAVAAGQPEVPSNIVQLPVQPVQRNSNDFPLPNEVADYRRPA